MIQVTLRRKHSIAILDCNGTIDIDASVFIEKIGWCLENGYRDILCNFDDVTFVDYPGLSVLAIAYKNVVNHKARLKFINIAAHLKKVFTLVYLDKVFEIYDTEEEAIKSFEEEHVISEIQKKQLRRRFKRLPLDIEMHFKPRSKDTQYIRGKILNISAVGLLVFADQAYPLEEILDMKLLLNPKPGLLEVQGKVVWLVQKELQPQLFPAMGVEFYHIDKEKQKQIVEFVERNLPLGCSNE